MGKVLAVERPLKAVRHLWTKLMLAESDRILSHGQGLPSFPELPRPGTVSVSFMSGCTHFIEPGQKCSTAC